MTGRNLILAIFISLHLAVLLVLLYVFFPLLATVLGVLLRGISSHGPETNGISVVAGGVREWVVMILIAAAILFTVVFVVLQKRSRQD